MSEPTKRELAEWYKRNAEAQRLVGAFLQAWAAVEFALDEVVAAALNLGPSQGVIVAANISTIGTWSRIADFFRPTMVMA